MTQKICLARYPQLFPLFCELLFWASVFHPQKRVVVIEVRRAKRKNSHITLIFKAPFTIIFRQTAELPRCSGETLRALAEFALIVVLCRKWPPGKKSCWRWSSWATPGLGRRHWWTSMSTRSSPTNTRPPLEQISSQKRWLFWPFFKNKDLCLEVMAVIWWFFQSCFSCTFMQEFCGF